MDIGLGDTNKNKMISISRDLTFQGLGEYRGIYAIVKLRLYCVVVKNTVSIPPSVSWKTLNKLLNSSGSQFPQLQNEMNAVQ